MGKLKTFKSRGILAVILLCIVVTITVRATAQINATDAAFAELADLLGQAEAFSGGHGVGAAGMMGSIGGQQAEATKSGFFTLLPAGQSGHMPRQSFTPPTAADIARLSCFDYLTRNIFLVDINTRLFETDVCVTEFLTKNQHIDTSVEGPVVLIVHAHSREMFVDSNPYDLMTGVVGVGRHLAEILSREHGLAVMHYTAQFDVLEDGRPMRDGSYERLEPVVRRILAENPSIQVIIDLHRDGVREHVAPMVTYIDGQRTARIMFVNGLSRRLRNDVATDLAHLPNPNQRANLAFTLQLQFAANQMYPGFARRAYLLPFRYSLHMAPKSILLEVGAQNNTLQEALNAMPHVANVIASIVQ